jgi:hypothetical protein
MGCFFGGLAGTFGGCCIVAVNENTNEAAMWEGTAFAGVSFIIMCSPIVIMNYEIDESKMFSVSFAVRITNDYNQRLYESLR